MTIKKCNYEQRVRTLAQREAGCPLDHCMCGTHDPEQKEHTCPVPEDWNELEELTNEAYDK